MDQEVGAGGSDVLRFGQVSGACGACMRRHWALRVKVRNERQSG